MSLANGRILHAIPGPSVMPDRVLRAMHRAAPDIYAGEIIEQTASIKRDLEALAGTRGDVALYICNGHGTWEASLSNIVQAGDKVLVLKNGFFGEGWAMIGEALGVTVQRLDFGLTVAADANRIEEVLRADTNHEIRAVLAVHVDTSTSIRNDIGTVRAAMDAAGHPALLAADCMASFGTERYEMDAWGVDVTIAGSQKGLMTPPGMGFVWANEKARAARRRLDRVSRYWNWESRIDPVLFYQNYCGTAPTHHLYGLREALDMIAEEGRENVWARHAKLARGIWAAVAAWGQGGAMRLNVADPAIRSHAVTALQLGIPDGTRLREWMVAQTGVTLGIGMAMENDEDPNADRAFRIGHMGHVNAHMVLGVLATMDAGMKALNIDHGPGALEAATAAITAG